MGKKAKILVVDDELEFAADLQTTLEAEDYHVVNASSRVEAEEITRREVPDLVILGTIAPRGDAFLLHRWLRKSSGFSEVPIIVIDAPREKRLIKGWRIYEGLQLDGEGFYFWKPLKPAAVLPQVEKLLDKVTKRIKVLVADDHTVVREGLHALLSLQRDMQVVGEAADGCGANGYSHAGYEWSGGDSTDTQRM